MGVREAEGETQDWGEHGLLTLCPQAAQDSSHCICGQSK